MALIDLTVFWLNAVLASFSVKYKQYHWATFQILTALMFAGMYFIDVLK